MARNIGSKYGDLVPDKINGIGGCKFGGMVWYQHTCMHAIEMLAGFNFAVRRHTAIPPNILATQ